MPNDSQLALPVFLGPEKPENPAQRRDENEIEKGAAEKAFAYRACRAAKLYFLRELRIDHGIELPRPQRQPPDAFTPRQLPEFFEDLEAVVEEFVAHHGMGAEHQQLAAFDDDGV